MRERSGFTRRLCVGAFVFLMLLTLVVSYVWLARNKISPYGGVPPLAVMKFYLAWQEHGWGSFHLGELLGSFGPQRSPLVYFLYLGYFFIWGLQTGREMLVNTLFLAITLAALFRLGRALYDECVALVAVAFFLSFPAVFTYSRLSFNEFALMGMVTLSISLLAETDYFLNRKYAVLFGIALGLAALTKYTFLLFIAGPLLVVSAYAALRKPHPQAPYNFLLSMLATLAVSLPWYGIHLSELWQRFHIDNIDASYKDFSFTGANLAAFWDSCRYYFQASTTIVPGIKSSLDANYLIIILCAALYCLFQAVAHKQLRSVVSGNTLLLLSWVSVPLAVLCLPVFIAIRHPSHLLPALPACALILSVTLLRIRLKAVKYTLLGCALCIGLPYWYINLCAPFLQLPVQQRLPLCIKASWADGNPASCHLRLVWAQIADLQKVCLLPSQENWRYKEILGFISEDYRDRFPQRPRMLLAGGEYTNCEYINLQMRDKVLIIEPFYTHRNILGGPAFFSGVVRGSSFDYIVLRDSPLSKRESLRAFIDFIKSRQEEFQRYYKEKKQFLLPDGSRAVLYKRSALPGPY